MCIYFCNLGFMVSIIFILILSIKDGLKHSAPKRFVDFQFAQDEIIIL